jgi:hypothetical protein
VTVFRRRYADEFRGGKNAGRSIISYRRFSTMSDQDLKAELERLRKENAALKKGAFSGIRLKVSEKGAVSVYGMGRFSAAQALRIEW